MEDKLLPHEVCCSCCPAATCGCCKVNAFISAKANTDHSSCHPFHQEIPDFAVLLDFFFKCPLRVCCIREQSLQTNKSWQDHKKKLRETQSVML